MIAPSAIERIVAAAIAAPSGDNCQPWRFSWDGEELVLRLDPPRAKHMLDHAGRLSLVALGCALEAIAIAATRERLDTQASLSLEKPRGEAWASIRFTPREEAPHDLADAIAKRVTDRRFYLGGSLMHAVFDDLRRDAASRPGLALYAIDRWPAELVDYITGADGYVWRDPDVYRDIIAWVRFSRAEVEATRDGVPWKGLGMEMPEIPGMRLLRSSLAAHVVARIGAHRAARVWVERHLASAAALVCITTRDPTSNGLVAAGRLAFSAWVRLNRAGYGVQPLAIQALQIHGAAASGLPAGMRADLVDLFKRGRGVVERAFGYTHHELPAWMLRTGLSTPLPDDMRTLRRSLEGALTSSARRR